MDFKRMNMKTLLRLASKLAPARDDSLSGTDILAYPAELRPSIIDKNLANQINRIKAP